MNKNNMGIRGAIFKHRLRHFEVAQALGIADTTFSKRLRTPIGREETRHILAVIEELAKSRR